VSVARGFLVLVSFVILTVVVLIIASLFGFTIAKSPERLAKNPIYTVECHDSRDNPIAQITISSTDNGKTARLAHNGQVMILPFVGNTLFFEEIYASGDARLVLELETHVQEVFGSISGICS
jgi:hypothetical protein